MIIQMKTIRENGVPMLQGAGNDFGSSLAKGLHENLAKITDAVGAGIGYKFKLASNTGLNMKAAANMENQIQKFGPIC